MEEIVGGDGSQPDTASLVILLVGSLVLFLFYLGLKYYTTDSFRWIKEYFLSFHWSDVADAPVERRRRGRFPLGREDQAVQCLAWLPSSPGSILQTTSFFIIPSFFPCHVMPCRAAQCLAWHGIFTFSFLSLSRPFLLLSLPSRAFSSPCQLTSFFLLFSFLPCHSSPAMYLLTYPGCKERPWSYHLPTRSPRLTHPPSPCPSLLPTSSPRCPPASPTTFPPRPQKTLQLSLSRTLQLHHMPVSRPFHPTDLPVHVLLVQVLPVHVLPVQDLPVQDQLGPSPHCSHVPLLVSSTHTKCASKYQNHL